MVYLEYANCPSCSRVFSIVSGGGALAPEVEAPCCRATAERYRELWPSPEVFGHLYLAVKLIDGDDFGISSAWRNESPLQGQELVGFAALMYCTGIELCLEQILRLHLVLRNTDPAVVDALLERRAWSGKRELYERLVRSFATVVDVAGHRLWRHEHDRLVQHRNDFGHGRLFDEGKEVDEDMLRRSLRSGPHALVALHNAAVGAAQRLTDDT